MKSINIWFLCTAAVVVGVLFGIANLTLGPGEQSTDTPATPAGASGNQLIFHLRNESEFVPLFDEFGRATPASDGENLIVGSKEMRHEALTLVLDVDGYVEYKAIMEQGDTLVYSWQVRDGSVYYDFHSHPHEADPDFFTRYREGEGQSDRGTVVAAYSGQHGWYWLNLGDQPVTINLEVAGFYDEIIEIALY